MEFIKYKVFKIIGNRIKKDAPGFKFTNLSTTKNPQYYFDFISFEDYFHLVKSKAINPSGTDPSIKMVQHFKKLTHPDYNKFIYAPDERIGGLGRFLIFIEDYVITLVNNKDEINNLIFKNLELEEFKDEFFELKEAIEKTGGYGKVSGGAKIEYFYLANKFIEKHRGIVFDNEDTNSIRSYLDNLIEILLKVVD